MKKLFEQVYGHKLDSYQTAIKVDVVYGFEKISLSCVRWD